MTSTPAEILSEAKLKQAERMVSYLKSIIPCEHPPSQTCSHSRACRLVHQWESLNA